jgi:hypothetical protein
METASFCGQCGTGIPAGNRFCTSCGTPSGVHQAVTPALAAAALADQDSAPANDTLLPPVTGLPSVRDDAEAPPDAPAVEQRAPDREPAAVRPMPGRPSRRGRGRWALIATAVVALAAAAVAVVFIATGGGDSERDDERAARGPSEATAYQEQVAKAFGPVLGANKRVSARLAALKGTRPDAARLAVQQAKDATTMASGAIAAMRAPNGQQELADAAQEVINRERAYLSAVESVLNHPTVAGASQLPSLSSDLIAALHAAGPTIAGEEETVAGADRLQAWARTTSRTLARRAAAKRAKARRERSGSSSNSGTTSNATRGTPCGSGVYAGPNTSCPFALNVRDAYYEAPGSRASVRVYSPVTGMTYTMDCRPAGDAVTCSGGNGASVTIE